MGLTCTSRANSPGFYVFWIRPYEVAECAFMRDLLRSGDHADLVERSYLRAQATVHAENFAINYSSQSHKIEDLAAGFPDRGVAVLLDTLIIEAVHLGNLT